MTTIVFEPGTWSPDRLTFDGPGCAKGLEGHLYVVEFVGRGIKVGRTSDPRSRIGHHINIARAFGFPVGRIAVSPPHADVVATERMLIAGCADLAHDDGRPTEYFDLTFDAAVAVLALIPIERGDREAHQARNAAFLGSMQRLVLGPQPSPTAPAPAALRRWADVLDRENA